MASVSDHRKTYLKIWISLLFLTLVTVAISYVEFGTFNILIAMLIATIKGTLVGLFFMHLKYDNRVNQVVFASAFVFLFIFVALTLSDVMYRQRIKDVKALAGSSHHH